MRNLVLVHTEECQARSDLEEIAEKVAGSDPSIHVLIAENGERNEAVNRKTASAPTLVFSPMNLLKYKPARGRVYQGGDIDKLKQYERFVACGIRTPKTALLARGTVYPPEEWGEQVVLKPLARERQSSGRVYLIGTRRLNRELLLENMFDRYHQPGGVIVQQFVNPGPELEYHRVLALFGEPLYIMRTVMAAPVDLDLKAHPNQTIVVANQAYGGGEKIQSFVDGPDFRAMALACYEAFPHRALQALDLLRSHQDGELYLIESNMRGNTWHFSSKFITERLKNNQHLLKQLTRDKLSQFGAFDVAAKVLAGRTEAEAT